MKIIIEIPDASLRAAVEAQVGTAVAALTHDAVKAKADEVIAKVFERFQPYEEARRAAENAVRPHIEKAVNDVLGQQYHTRRENVHKLVKDAAAEAIKAGLK